jgi:hypothetical protein
MHPAVWLRYCRPWSFEEGQHKAKKWIERHVRRLAAGWPCEVICCKTKSTPSKFDMEIRSQVMAWWNMDSGLIIFHTMGTNQGSILLSICPSRKTLQRLLILTKLFFPRSYAVLNSILQFLLFLVSMILGVLAFLNLFENPLVVLKLKKREVQEFVRLL